MATTYAAPVGATPARPVRAHPIHGMLSAYPLAFFTGAVVTDITYANTAQMQWANFSVWMIAAGVFMGILAAIAGIVDAIMHRGSHRRAGGGTLHSVLTIAMMVVAVINGFIHSRDAWTSVVPTGLILSVITALLAVASSWLGFTLLARQETRR